jgi:Skp family chaperone for outer membrane proteins
MKTFQQFNEDLRQLQRNLDALDRQAEPGRKLTARRKAAAIAAGQRSKTFEKKSRQTAADVEARHQQMRKYYKERLKNKNK